jgi:hypothetical protein
MTMTVTMLRSTKVDLSIVTRAMKCHNNFLVRRAFEAFHELRKFDISCDRVLLFCCVLFYFDTLKSKRQRETERRSSRGM